MIRHDTLPIYEFAIDVRITNRDTSQLMTLDYGQDGYSEMHAQSLVAERARRNYPASTYDIEIVHVECLPFIDRQN